MYMYIYIYKLVYQYIYIERDVFFYNHIALHGISRLYNRAPLLHVRTRFVRDVSS